MAAVDTHHVDDESQFLSRERHVLLLESALLRLVRPTEILVQVNASDHAHCDANQTPADRLAELQCHTSNTVLSRVVVLLYKWEVRTESATAPATTPEPVESLAACATSRRTLASVLWSGGALLGICGVSEGGICVRKDNRFQRIHTRLADVHMCMYTCTSTRTAVHVHCRS